VSGSRRNMKRVEVRETRDRQISLPEPIQEAQGAAMEPRGLSAARLLTAEELAERWQVPKSHVYRLSRTGQIPLVRLGRYFRYRLDVIEAWEKEPNS
jgi:excisionase family DNA binding protein